MAKFEPLTPEQVKEAEKEALEKFSTEEKQVRGEQPIRANRYREGKEYRSRTPAWAKNWLARCFHPFGFQNQKASPDTSQQETTELEKKSRVLGRFRSMFPFTLFPDELIVEENRVIWKNWLGPGMTSVTSIMATDISNVQASHGPFFGHIHIGSLVGGPEILMEKLSRADAVKARALIEGIILTARERLAIRKKEVTQEEEELSKLGEVRF